MSYRDALVRGTMLFFGVFSLGNTLGTALGSSAENIWWIDLGFVELWLAVPLALSIAVVLIAQAMRPRIEGAQHRAAIASCGFLAYAALLNMRDFYSAWETGSIAPQVSLPLSAVLAGVFVLLSWGVLRQGEFGMSHMAWIRIVGVALVAALVFPLAQVTFFGTTDYRRPAQAVVVLGAKAWPDGRLSTSLEDRVRTAVGLYEQGLVSTLVMSGGTGAEGVDESVAMRDRAVALGVPSGAILLDPDGVNTDATVANTTEMMRAREFDRVLVVSQFYHLPRIKMAYRAAGLDVCTVPAEESRPIPRTPYFVLREVPGFWVYWARGLVRGAV